MTQTPRRTAYPPVMTQADVAVLLACGRTTVSSLPIRWAKHYPALRPDRWYRVWDMGQDTHGVFLDAGRQ